MYKAVLLDDERIIVDGLKKAKWNNYRCVVVGIALYAKSGANLIRELSSDIGFTDT